MPVYGWKGLDLDGRIAHGILFARSLADLESFLLKKNIGLITARPSLVARKITSSEKSIFFSHLGSLLTAHIPLYDALTIIAATTQSHLKPMITDCAALIAEGIPLSEALKMHGLADELAYALICVGEKTGDLSGMIQDLVDHQKIMDGFKQKMREAVRSPLITAFFFLMVVIGIFVGVIPRFEVYFASYNAQLPLITRAILAMSSFLRSFFLLYTAIGCGIVAILIYPLVKRPQAKMVKDALCFTMPGLSSFCRAVYRARFYAMLSMLIKKRVPLVQALYVAEKGTQNSMIKKEIVSLRSMVESGKPLSAALHESFFAYAEIDALIVIGESSASLSAVLTHAAELSRQRIYNSIDRWITFINPLLLLLLGALIAGLVFAIYMPLLSLSLIVE